MSSLLDSFTPSTKKNIQEWLDGPYDAETKKEILQLIKKNPQQAESSFFRKLSFGTGGIRALMGVGTNRLNRFTIQFATQAVANHLKKIYPKEPLKVIVGYDNRHCSRSFAEETAQVLAGNAIHTFLFEELRPTPLISFGCRYLSCHAAIMITASHNPPEYNGFKVYGKDGGQLLPPHDAAVLQELEQIQNPKNVLLAPLSHPLIERVLKKIDQAYLQLLPTISHFDQQNKKEGRHLHIIYTNLHGTGLTLLPKALQEWGFSHITYVDKQKSFDGNFPFAPKPNPEEKEALQPGLALLLEKKADILLATDPDADRIALAIHHQGKPYLFSGNELASLLLYHICSSLEEKKKLPLRAAFVKTIVTTELFSSIAKGFHGSCFDVLTGFKYIAELIERWDRTKEHAFIFGAEESYGYLANTFVRDKDAISTGCLIAEMALKAKREKRTLLDLLYSLYQTYGIFQEELFSLSYPEGKEGMEKIEKMMATLRKNPPTLFGNCELSSWEDYQESKGYDRMAKKTFALSLPKSNVLRFWLTDQSKIVIRPSGTEPKIKIYIGTTEKNFSHVAEGVILCKKRADALLQSVKKYLL